MNPTESRPKFNPGRILMTPGALELMGKLDQHPGAYLFRHIRGDWGVLDKGDSRMNDRALKTGDRILSSYGTGKDSTIWIISEAVDIESGADPAVRETTTILLPEEY